MTRDRLVSLFVVLTAVAVGVVVWVLMHRHERTVVHERTQTAPLVVEIPPQTPLRDSGPKNNARARHRPAARQSPRSPTASRLPPTTAGSQNRPLPSHNRKTAKTPRKTHPKRQRPVYTPPGNGSAPPPSQRPPVDVQLPAPLTVCARPAGGVNCP